MNHLRHPSACACRGCRQAAELRAWSERVVRAGELNITPPPVAAVWAAIRRNTENAWESALARSFHRLVPYLAGLTAILVIVGSLALRSPAPATAEGAPSTQSLLAPATTVAANEAPLAVPDLLGLSPR